MAWKEAFLGFEFKGKHSSEFNIMRTSEGNRLKKQLTPSFSAITQDIPGADGMYYFGAKVDGQELPVNFAFDSMTEKQYNDLKLFVNQKEPGVLKLDENGDKYYLAKISGSSVLKHLCFAQDGVRTYKGNGSINFTLLNPYLARAVAPEWTRTPHGSDETKIIYSCEVDNDGWADANYILKFQPLENGSFKCVITSSNKTMELALDKLSKDKIYTLNTKKKILVDSDGILWNAFVKNSDFAPFEFGKYKVEIELDKSLEQNESFHWPELTYYCQYGA